MAEVRGVGGIFIYSEDVPSLANWYQTVLGIDMELHPNGETYYRVFQTRDLETHVVRENPVFAIYPADEPLARSGRGFSLGLRVDDLDAYLAELKDQGVQTEGEMLIWAGGKHMRIRDPDGNLIEFYEEILLEEA